MAREMSLAGEWLVSPSLYPLSRWECCGRTRSWAEGVRDPLLLPPLPLGEGRGEGGGEGNARGSPTT